MPDDAIDAHEEGIRHALAAGYALLERGASSVDAVEAAVAVMEDDETFDAGRGSFLTRDGKVQMDALLMDGATLRTGGVACVERAAEPNPCGRGWCSTSRRMCTSWAQARSGLPASMAWRCATTWTW